MAAALFLSKYSHHTCVVTGKIEELCGQELPMVAAVPCILDDERLLPLCEKLDQLLEKHYRRKFVVQECDLELLLGLLRDIIVSKKVPSYRIESDFIIFEHNGIVYAIHIHKTACFYAQ